MHATPQPLDSTPLPARDRRRLFIRAIAVGFAAGLLSIAFRYSLQAADDLRTALLEQGPLVAISFAILSISLGVFLVHRFAPEAAGSGIPHVEGVLHLGLPFRWIRVIVVKAVGGVLAIGGGLTLGREGPTVQLGAATGAGIGWFGRASGEERRSLIAIGAGAGLSATFNAPLAGMAFVFEELRGGYRPGDYLAALLACSVSDSLARAAFGQGPIFGALRVLEPALTYLPLALIIGVLGGVLGVFFNSCVLRSVLGIGRLQRRGLFVLGFASLIGLCGWIQPDLVGDGHHLLGKVLREAPLPRIAMGLVMLRFLLTLGSYACGAAGGLFTPILVIGAYLGAAAGGFARDDSHTILAVILGMASLFTGSIRAPVTGILLMVEMTGSYAIILPLLVAVLAAEFVAGELGGKPLYAELLERNPLYHGRGRD